MTRVEVVKGATGIRRREMRHVLVWHDGQWTVEVARYLDQHEPRHRPVRVTMRMCTGVVLVSTRWYPWRVAKRRPVLRSTPRGMWSSVRASARQFE